MSKVIKQTVLDRFTVLTTQEGRGAYSIVIMGPWCNECYSIAFTKRAALRVHEECVAYCNR